MDDKEINSAIYDITNNFSCCQTVYDKESYFQELTALGETINAKYLFKRRHIICRYLKANIFWLSIPEESRNRANRLPYRGILPTGHFTNENIRKEIISAHSKLRATENYLVDKASFGDSRLEDYHLMVKNKI